jgi:2-polyprenyl-3-methyl-5-hydroxy-6-metoxy-1,4-benzoquinol methylase
MPFAALEKTDRFAFGTNWRHFLTHLDDQRIAEAERSLQDMLNVTTLKDQRFLDIGCGSGLFSLAAMRLGAAHVHSFDYDPESVDCARALKRQFYPADPRWTIDQGDVLDPAFVATLAAERWDIVYAWGVLHHTGNLWLALQHVADLVPSQATLFLSIYNDQGTRSRIWRLIKKTYNQGRMRRMAIQGIFIPYFVTRSFVMELLRGHNPLGVYRNYQHARGMSRVHDWYDWLGGYPFEVAHPDEIFAFHRSRGFVLDRLKSRAMGLGCNEYVFHKP